MKLLIEKTFDFEASHRLPKVAAGHKCGRMHGHSYSVTIQCEADEDALEDGMVVDYAVMADAWAPLYETLDHRTLNDVPGLDNPTTEVLAVWLYMRLRRAALPFFARVIVKEAKATACVFPAP